MMLNLLHIWRQKAVYPSEFLKALDQFGVFTPITNFFNLLLLVNACAKEANVCSVLVFPLISSIFNAEVGFCRTFENATNPASGLSDGL